MRVPDLEEDEMLYGWIKADTRLPAYPLELAWDDEDDLDEDWDDEDLDVDWEDE